MYNATDFQTQYTDTQRQMARLNAEGWQFFPPTPRIRVRPLLAQALREMLAQTLQALTLVRAEDPTVPDPHDLSISPGT